MVQRLANPNLVPSSMNGGNTVADDPGLSMTAPGSPSISPVPDVLDRLPLPVPSGPQVPVSTEQDRVHSGMPASSPTWKTTASHGQSFEGP